MHIGNNSGILAVIVALATSSAECRAAEEGANHVRRDYPIRPVAATAVRFADEFWAPRLETNRTATIPTSFAKCEETHRRENFLIAAGKSDAAWEGDYGFNDSDIYKVIEGASYALMTRPDPKLDEYLDGLIADVAAAQEPSGYLYTLWTAKKKPANYDRMVVRVREKPFDNLQHDHELYNYGHLYEAAVAHHAATGKRSLLDVAIRTADQLVREFGPGKIESTSGHPEIEVGLVKLYRATGKQEYLDLARYFIDLRGRKTKDRPQLWGEYCQDHAPMLEQDEAVGHAVRALYLYAGVADVAALTGDERYVAVMDRLWRNVVGKKLYVTGGVGATGRGEAFGRNFELPNATAYCETCAQIANVLWNHRLFLLHGDAKYADVMERTLYNGFLSGVALDGTHFFYPNPLASDGGAQRSEWFGCPCCPSNVCRFMPSTPGFVYGVRDDVIYVNLFVAGEATLDVDGGQVVVRQETKYPWDGRIRLTVTPSDPGRELTLKVRVPEWARNIANAEGLYEFADAAPKPARVTLDGEPAWRPADGGYATISREWNGEEIVELDLPMPVRRVIADERVVADRGRTALQRGPLVYCLEHPDVPDGQVSNLVVPDDAPFAPRVEDSLLGGVTVLEGTVTATHYEQHDGERQVAAKPVAVRAIPYYAWAHRGRGQMAVWLPRTLDAADPLPAPTVANRSRVTASPGAQGNLAAVADGRVPRRSIDHEPAFIHWWPRKGEEAWIEYDFTEPVRVTAVEAYWFDDTGLGECRVPAAWKLMLKDEAGEWDEAPGAAEHGCEPDRMNRCEIQPRLARGLRLELTMQPGWSAGVHEVSVETAER
ncbi:MAG: glycoside hydrolase family 127 protein [Pirellulales bacterium]|nr:glycoside hydrolase family 127 protein [Pirellulales bacterium]